MASSKILMMKISTFVLSVFSISIISEVPIIDCKVFPELSNSTTPAENSDCNFGGLLCPMNQTCVTYEKDCGLGAMCALGADGLRTYECVLRINSGIPKIPLCEDDEIFVRGYMRACSSLPCPPLWTYKCYPKAVGFANSCENIKCPDHSHCVIEERCRGEFCYPRYTCSYYLM